MIMDSMQDKHNDGCGASMFFFTIDGITKCYVRSV